jgi:hypothetical protein
MYRAEGVSLEGERIGVVIRFDEARANARIGMCSTALQTS